MAVSPPSVCSSAGHTTGGSFQQLLLRLERDRLLGITDTHCCLRVPPEAPLSPPASQRPLTDSNLTSWLCFSVPQRR